MIQKKTNYFLIPLVVVVLVALALYSNQKVDLSSYTTEGVDVVDFPVSEEIALLDPKLVPTAKAATYDESLLTLGKSFTGFKEAIAFKESGGDYFRVSSLGYLGKYQFGKQTLKSIGISNTQLFLKTPELQEKAFLAYMKRNKWILRKDIKQFVGENIDNVKVTESGILAAAHLAGAGSVKKFLRSYGTNNFKDALGTSVKYYMKKFSGYNTSNIVANRAAKVVM